MLARHADSLCLCPLSSQAGCGHVVTGSLGARLTNAGVGLPHAHQGGPGAGLCGQRTEAQLALHRRRGGGGCYDPWGRTRENGPFLNSSRASGLRLPRLQLPGPDSGGACVGGRPAQIIFLLKVITLLASLEANG